MTSFFSCGKKYWVQVLLLTFVSFLSVAPRLVQSGTNVVTDTYAMGAERVWGGSSPYQEVEPGLDWFKYSPLFAVLYRPFTLFNSTVHSLLWAWLNICIFWMGVSAWFTFGRDTSGGLWAALVVCAMELNISNLHQQVNPLVTGMILLALAAYRDHRDATAGMLLGLATNFKVFPAPFLVLLGIPHKNRYRLSALGCLLGSLLIPILAVGWDNNVLFHTDWIALLFKEVQGQGLADVGSFLGRIGFAGGDFLRHVVMAATIAALGWPLVRGKEPLWGLWFSVGVTGILLWNPRTESPTFVLVAPAYLFLMDFLLRESRVRKAGLWVLSICLFLITVSFTDIWPKSFWNAKTLFYASKTMGTLVLWGLASVLFWRKLKDSSSEHPSP